MNHEISPQRRRGSAESFSSLRNLRVLHVSAVKFRFTGPYFALLPLLFSLTVGQTLSKLTRSEDESKLMLGNRVLLDSGKDGFMSIKQIRRSPDGKHFAVIACGYECNDNVGFLFNTDGSGKRKITARWDFILQDKIEWSADGKKLYYFRINSTGADPPTNGSIKSWPTTGWVQVDVTTGRKVAAVSRTLKTTASYAVFNVAPNDSLNVREMPELRTNVTGQLAHNARGIKFTGEKQKSGRETWVKIKLGSVSGWVNQNYLYEEPSSNQFIQQP